MLINVPISQCEFCGDEFAFDYMRKYVIGCPNKPFFLDSRNQRKTGETHFILYK